MNALNTWNTTAVANLDAAREVEAQLLKSETGLIASSNLIEQNAKVVNDIYLGTIGKNGELAMFDADQAGILFDISNHCPLVGGNPVYQARSLYALVDVEAEFDDALLCASAGYVVKSAEEPVPYVSVYPNPTLNGQLFFELIGSDQELEQVMMVLYDVQARPVKRQIVRTTKGIVDVSTLAQGMYQWSLLVGGKLIDQGKVAIF